MIEMSEPEIVAPIFPSKGVENYHIRICEFFGGFACFLVIENEIGKAKDE